MRMVTTILLCSLLLLCTQAVPSRACTSFCFDTDDGPFFATNLDLTLGEGHIFVNRSGIAKVGYRASTTGEIAEWVSRYGSVTFNLVGRELPWSGINEAGLVMSSMQLNASKCPDPDERPPLSEASIVQYVLDICETVPDVIEAVSRVRLPPNECANHYLVADENGECVVIEFLNGEFVYYTGETMPVNALANAPYAAGIVFMEMGVIPADNPGESVERVAAAVEMIDRFLPDHGVSPVEYSLGVLTNTVVAPKKWWSDLFDEPYTRWNVVYDIVRREIHFRTVTDPTVRNVSLSSFDFSCEAPLLMLDINAGLEGNIDRSLGPYDHDVNLETFRTFCDKWGIEVSEEASAELIRLFESFECVSETP